ncbi:hypothetical protein [Flavobacterium sp. LS1R10]|uniref:hypothetical protein n=1 Tax=Flavobacterium sp. LS1R10 TaxID=2497482 RepID=UPI000F827B04|nr:hypothetical protein [Flavobacterium sp. LS1R10]RTY74182.1 hypothetical protein EKL96_08940 [Flavobacterium sp. LS1R10]
MGISIAVILFQIGIFLLMTYAGYKGIWYLNILTIIIIIFTLANIHTSPLMILQFFTVIASYSFCLNRIEVNKYPSAYFPRKKHSIELIIIILLNIIILSLIIYGWGRFTIYYFEENYESLVNEWFLQILGVISYLLFLGFTLMISGLLYFNLKKVAKELFSRF